MIFDAPAIRAAWRTASPTPPIPNTTTLSPSRTRAEWWTAPYPVSTAQPSSAASSSGMPAGAGSTQFAATTVSWAKAATLRPGWSSVPSGVRAWMFAAPFSASAHSQTSPIPQWKHAPQDGAQLRTTGSPAATWVTPSPTASTVPAPSWPRTAGTGSLMVPSDRDRSEWQTPAAASETLTWPGPGSGSSMSVISRGAPTAGSTAARTTNRLLGGSSGGSELEGLGLEVLGEAVRAEFTAHPGLLVTAEGGQGVEAAAVDVDLPGVHAAGEGDGLLVVRAPDGAGQPVDGAVGDPQGVVHVLVPQDGEDRAEDLLLGDRHVRGDVGEDRGADVVALVPGRLGASRDEAGALLDALLDVSADPGLLLGVDDRADPLPRHVLGDGGGGECHGLLVPLGVDQHPGPRAAGLAGVGHHVGDADVDGLGEVGTGQDHVGGLAAQFEGDAFDGRSRGGADPPADGRGPGERDQVDALVLGQRLTCDRPDAGDQVEDAGGQTGLLDGLSEELRGERGVLVRLQDDGAARGQRRGHLGDDLVERVVPGRDRADDADGLQQDRRVAQLLREGVRGGEFGVGTGDQHRHAGVHRLGERQRRAELRGDRPGDLVLAGGEHVTQRGDPPGALGGRGGRPAGEGGPCGTYGRVDVLGRTRRDMADDLLVRRVHDRDRVRARGGPPLPADVHPVMRLHGCPSRARCACRRSRARTDGCRPGPKLALLVFRRQGSAGEAPETQITRGPRQPSHARPGAVTDRSGPGGTGRDRFAWTREPGGVGQAESRS